MKLLLLGPNGQVGWQLRRSLPLLGDLTIADRNSGGDLSKPEQLLETIRRIRPDVVVNAAAYTAVDRAEDEAELAFAINARASEALAHATNEAGSWLVHYSTDYVYRGDGYRAWVETDTPQPLGVYGKSKLAGDLAVMRNPRHLIFRTCWVFDTWGANFLKTILRAAAQRDELRVVNDQWGTPTRAATVADVTTLVLHQLMHDVPDTGRAGVYHLAAAGQTNWHEYAEFSVSEAATRGMPMRATGERIRPVAAAEYGARAPRPANSRLDTTRLQEIFGIHLPDWQDGVRAVVAELAAKEKT